MSYFYVDPVKESTYTWSKFINDLNHIDNVESHCYHSDFYRIFLSLTSAILNGSDVTVVDGELTESEVEKLLGAGNINELGKTYTRKYSNITDKFDLISRIRKPNNSGIVLFTSGTTGKPKAVRQTVENLARAVIVKPTMVSDVWGFAYHPTHIAGIQVFLQAVSNGNTIVRLFGLQPDQLLKAVNEWKITNISATPTFLRLFLPANDHFPTVKRITSGGEKMDSLLLEKLSIKFPNARFRNIYATTEFGTLFKSGSEGFQVTDDLKAYIKIDANELLVHKCLLGEFDDAKIEGEWYRTGDLVDITCENPLTLKIIGRKNEMVNVGGMKVNITEVEEEIRKLFDVRFVKVIPKSNSVVGNILICEISFNGNSPNESEIRKILSDHLQEYKIPRIIKIVDVIDSNNVTRTMKLNRSNTKE